MTQEGGRRKFPVNLPGAARAKHLDGICRAPRRDDQAAIAVLPDDTGITVRSRNLPFRPRPRRGRSTGRALRRQISSPLRSPSRAFRSARRPALGDRPCDSRVRRQTRLETRPERGFRKASRPSDRPRKPTVRQPDLRQERGTPGRIRAPIVRRRKIIHACTTFENATDRTKRRRALMLSARKCCAGISGKAATASAASPSDFTIGRSGDLS
ncbi:hypothetical protein PARHAE_00009 [Paracoccus haematequi]|uniref:Uncharacterized protein n=1 Tax=Paracoccus haematequi TaxID=2491866 RepID=A0A447IHC1_9RHOB|nr:hypothetical protein PARHAE_00009 [Paracoccus haematequi]